MKIKKEYILREIAGQSIIVPIGKASLDSRGIMTLKGCGVFLFKEFQKGIEKNELLEKVLNEFNVDKATAESDIEEFVVNLKKLNLLEE